MARERGAWVICGGIQASLYPDEAFEHGCADGVRTGDGEIGWGGVSEECRKGAPERIYSGGQIKADEFKPARWDLLPPDSYMWASVQTVRGCPKHCSFCSVWRTDGQQPRQRTSDIIIEEIVQLRRRGFRFVALADHTVYPVSLTDIRLSERQNNQHKLAELHSLRDERFELMARLSALPKYLTFFTQITMEA